MSDYDTKEQQLRDVMSLAAKEFALATKQQNELETTRERMRGLAQQQADLHTELAKINKQRANGKKGAKH